MLGRKKYAFVGEEEEEEQPTRSRRHGKMADEDEGGEDTFVDQFFSKRPEIQIQTKIQHSRKPSSRAAAAASSSTFVQPRLKYRAKPDLTSDEEDDDHRQDISTFSSSSSKPTAGEVRKRQHLAEKRFELLQLARDKERREHLEQLKHDRIQREEQKLKQKFWMGEILQGAFRSRDDRGGANGQQLVLRRDTLKETAREYAHGRHVFQAAFISHPGVKAGRFYLEPQGSKSTETNSHNTVLYLILERTGAEGVTIRVDKKFYEVFEGDSVLVPEGAIYAVINPSKTMGCTLLYINNRV
ncbi:hypothetical protein BASA81_009872 [Batrachochytrium salamandrivorans]|nr:hypothetical protein BASA81_009872 [Batrachochytrium salamandrivorans]